MSIFDILGLASRVPYDLVQKLEADLPKLQQLLALERQAEPHVNALMPIVKEAEALWQAISPDVLEVLQTLGVKK